MQRHSPCLDAERMQQTPEALTRLSTSGDQRKLVAAVDV